MKLKTDFVSNSSSASFIVYIPSEVTSLDAFKGSLMDIIKERFIPDELYDVNDDTRKAYERALTIVDSAKMKYDGLYTLEHFTAMFNSIVDDTPLFMKWLVLENMVGGFKEYGIKDVKLTIDEDGGF